LLKAQVTFKGKIDMAETSIHGSSTQTAGSRPVNPTGNDPSSLLVTNSAEESSPGLGEPNDEEIAARAYEYWKKRGGAHGSSEEDWYRAEEELRAERAHAKHRRRSAAASA
jgi:hypothetical protein